MNEHFKSFLHKWWPLILYVAAVLAAAICCAVWWMSQIFINL